MRPPVHRRWSAQGVRFPAGLLPPRSSRAPASAEQPVEWCQSFGRVRERPSVSEESDGVATGRPAALLERDGIERADVAGQVGLEWLDQLLMRSIRSSTHSFHAICLPARSKMRPVDARIRCGVRHDGLVVHTDDEGCGRARAPVALPAQPGRTPARTKLEGMRSQWSAFASIIAVDGTISFENEEPSGRCGRGYSLQEKGSVFYRTAILGDRRRCDLANGRCGLDLCCEGTAVSRRHSRGRELTRGSRLCDERCKGLGDGMPPWRRRRGHAGVRPCRRQCESEFS